MPLAALRLVLVLPALVALAQPAAAQPGEILPLGAGPVALDGQDAERTRVGRLVWRGGLELDSADDRFGGLSGLWLSDDGSVARSQSDEGWWVSFPVSYDAAGDLADVGDGRIGVLHDSDGRSLGGDKHWGDAEGLAPLADGSVAISFEREHRIQRYAGWPPTGTPTALPVPPGHAPGANEGLESLGLLPDGRLLAISEGLTAERDGRAVWQGFLAPAPGADDWQAFALPQDDDLAPVDATVGPEGAWLYWLERGWSAAKGIRVKVKRAPLAAVRPGALLAPEELAFLRAPLAVDNIEGIAVRRGPAGETLLTLISDDNFNPIQRTLLLQFELAE